MKRSDWVVSLVVLCCVFTGPARAQEVPGGGDAINLFFVCQGGGCYDLGFLRREIPLVNWVRDREVSDLYVLVTSQRTGGGGLNVTLAFIGMGDFEGQDQELTLSTAGDATPDEQPRAISDRSGPSGCRPR